MPTYEYRCKRCNHQFEAVHAVGESVDRCERCGGPVRRVFSPPALIFKGSGFHITDYRKTPAPSEADGKTSGAEKGTSGKGTTAAKTESKSTTKTESKSATKTSGSGGTGNGSSSAGEGQKAS